MLSLPPFLNCGCAARAFFGRKLCLWSGILVALTSVQTVSGQQADAGPGRSPFLPQGWEQRGSAAQARPTAAETGESGYVFNGMIQIGSRTLFSIGNTQTGHATLIEAGDTSGDIQIASYDPQRNIVSLKGAGRSEELTLRKSDGEPMVVAATANSGPGANRAQGNVQGRSPHNAQGAAATRSGPPVEWLEARRNRLNEQIEQRRAQQAAEGSGAVAVGVDGNSGATASAGGGRQSGSNVQRSSQGESSGQSGQNVRPRRLRMEMNP